MKSLSSLYFPKTEARSCLLYTECPSSRVIALVLFITACSALDALFTLMHVSEGGQEVNPYVGLLLTYGETTFVSLKMAVMGAGSWVLAALHHVLSAYLALHGLALTFMAVLGIHGVMLLH